MHDIKWIRDNPAAFDEALARRGLSQGSHDLLMFDERRRAVIAKLQTMQERRNAVSREVGEAKKAKDENRAQALMSEVTAIKEEMPKLEAEQQEVEQKIEEILLSIPNLPARDVPAGKDSGDNVEYRRHGEKPNIAFKPKLHFEIGESLGLMDFEAASRISGARFVVLKGALARLERALAQFFLDIHTGEHGYTEISPPVLVKDAAMYGTAQLPKFRDDQFRAGEDYWLIPTAEVPLTNLASGEIVDEAKLPMRLTACTPCFRAEAGAAGKDTRGMIRQHQFTKVELVSITAAEQSAEEHERMLQSAEKVLQKLGLHYRVMTLCTGDMGFASQKTYDIEVWLPGEDTYREISSCSNCGDFQARRMNARYRAKEAKNPRYVHTLNGSGVAVGRALIAVLENYQTEDGSVIIPDVLKPYMGGLDKITKAN